MNILEIPMGLIGHTKTEKIEVLSPHGRKRKPWIPLSASL